MDTETTPAKQPALTAHFTAACTGCSWAEGSSDIGKLDALARQHVAETGHDIKGGAGGATAEQPADAGQQLLDQLGLDAQPVEPTDQHLYAQGCLVSALALHVPPGRYTSVALLTPPGDEGPDIEVRCPTSAAAAEVAEALPWPHPPITRIETGELHHHHVTRGVLWGNRIAVVGLEPLGGAA